MLGFIDAIDLYCRKQVTGAKDSDPLSSKELIYRRFLLYAKFFAAERPVVLCEGETDNVYLTHAIRSLAPSYPDLATAGPKAKISLNVRLYKYRRSSTARILDFRDGGSSFLARFLAMYKKETAKFKAPGEKYPVIILCDNDTGAKSIRSAVKAACGKTLASQSFVHVVRNLYVVPTPLPTGATESHIEDFFDATVKATVISRKTFEDTNNFDTATHYGKKVFAHKVVTRSA